MRALAAMQISRCILKSHIGYVYPACSIYQFVRFVLICSQPLPKSHRLSIKYSAVIEHFMFKFLQRILFLLIGNHLFCKCLVEFKRFLCGFIQNLTAGRLLFRVYSSFKAKGRISRSSVKMMESFLGRLVRKYHYPHPQTRRAISRLRADRELNQSFRSAVPHVLQLSPCHLYEECPSFSPSLRTTDSSILANWITARLLQISGQVKPKMEPFYP